MERRGLFAGAVCAVALYLAGGSVCFAAEDAAKRVNAAGTVNAVKDDKGQVTSATFISGVNTYEVLLDDKGKELAKLAGKTVELTGALVTSENKQVLRADSFDELLADTVKVAKTRYSTPLTLEANGTTYYVEPDKEGKELMAYNGRKAEVTGKVTTKKELGDELQWLKVMCINQSVTGVVEVTKDEKGQLIAVKVVFGQGAGYNVHLDDEGKELGAKMAGRLVRITCIFTGEQKDNIWLKVKRYDDVRQLR